MNRQAIDLQDAHVLILEDDYYLATDLQNALEAGGAVVIGPFPDEADARRSIEASLPDCAFVDVNLGRGPSFEVPRALIRHAIPFAFVTGYDAGAIPDEFEAIPRFEKPIETTRIVEVALRLLGNGGAVTR